MKSSKNLNINIITTIINVRKNIVCMIKVRLSTKGRLLKLPLLSMDCQKASLFPLQIPNKELNLELLKL